MGGGGGGGSSPKKICKIIFVQPLCQNVIELGCITPLFFYAEKEDTNCRVIDGRCIRYAGSVGSLFVWLVS